MAATQLEDVKSWSEVKTWQRCQKQYEYKYIDRLEAVRKGRALYTGSWIHACLETHYRDGNWQIGHQMYLDEYNKLFDEEKEELMGRSKTPLPTRIERIMVSYLWYYREDGWEVIATEQDLRTVIKAPVGFKGRTDLIIRDADSLNWAVDHKSTGNIPDARSYHGMDPQLMLYPWAIEKELRIKLAGVIYNYVNSKPPSIPKLTKTGQLSRSKIVTDYPTLYRFLRKNGYDVNDYAHVLRPLMKRSPLLRRYRMPREAFVTKQVIGDFYGSVLEIRAKREQREAGKKVVFIRNITKECDRFCQYSELCRQELNGFDASILRKTAFRYRKETDVDPTGTEYESTQDEG